MRRTLGVLVLFVHGVAAAAPVESPITRTSRPVRLLRSWHEPVKTPAGEFVRRVDILYDYRKAAAFEQAYTLDGRLLQERRIVVNPPAPSQEEIQEAFLIVRRDAETRRILERFTAQLEGGFLIEEGRGKACGRERAACSSRSSRPTARA